MAIDDGAFCLFVGMATRRRILARNGSELPAIGWTGAEAGGGCEVGGNDE